MGLDEATENTGVPWGPALGGVAEGWAREACRNYCSGLVISCPQGSSSCSHAWPSLAVGLAASACDSRSEPGSGAARGPEG